MASMNIVVLVGNLTRDVELKYTPNGTAVARIGVAMNRTWRDSKTNEKREDVCFQEVVIWGKAAETANQYLGKGRLVGIQGRLSTESWIDKQTQQKRSRNVVICERLNLMPSGQKAQQQPAAAAPAGETVIDEPGADDGPPPI